MSDPNGVTRATAVRSSEPCAAHERQAHLLQRLLRPPTRLSAGAGAQHRRASGTQGSPTYRRISGAKSLTTEHWSLLSTRSLSWNDAFSRVATILSALSAAVVALALGLGRSGCAIPPPGSQDLMIDAGTCSMSLSM